jgi:hypothetical protein
MTFMTLVLETKSSHSAKQLPDVAQASHVSWVTREPPSGFIAGRATVTTLSTDAPAQAFPAAPLKPPLPGKPPPAPPPKPPAPDAPPAASFNKYVSVDPSNNLCGGDALQSSAASGKPSSKNRLRISSIGVYMRPPKNLRVKASIGKS